MQRYFVGQFNLDGFLMNSEDLHHIKKVMRMKNKDQIICINQSAEVYLCEIEDIGSGLIKVLEKLNENHELPVKVHLIYALPKGDKFEFVLQKACELGVHSITPLMTKRSVIKTDAQKFSKKYDRYRKILKESAEQSYRNIIPNLQPLIQINEIANMMSDYNIVAYEQNAKNNEISVLKNTLSQMKKGESITIIVGCEGGFDPSEIEKLNKMGVLSCSLGKRILRSETAPLYMLSAISYALELE